jgi:hypothetical protein
MTVTVTALAADAPNRAATSAALTKPAFIVYPPKCFNGFLAAFTALQSIS